MRAILAVLTCFWLSAAFAAGEADEAILSKYKIALDYGFTSTQRHFIAAAVGKIPECYRKGLAGMKIVNNTGLRWSDGHACLSGRQVSTLPPQLELNASCGFDSDLVLHEMFHIVGHRGLLKAYQKSFQAYPDCPVSQYSAVYRGRNVSEDFAEAARMVSVKNARGSFNQDCVLGKLQALKALMESCN